MEAFLERFYDEVDDNLADPHSQKRFTKDQRYRDLTTIQKRMFERLLSASGQESNIGRAEVDIEVVDGQEFYDLPPGFRQFIAFEKRIDGDPNDLEGQLFTVPTYSQEPGIEIISADRGFRMQPVPDSGWAGTWTLVFNKGPVPLHYATSGKVANMPSLQSLAGYTVTTTKVTKSDTFTKAMIGETVTFSGGALAATTSTTITDATADYIEFAAVTGLDDTASMTINADWCWLVAGTPATYCGEAVKLDDYYVGCLLRVFSATAGSRQRRYVLEYYEDPTTAGEWHYKLRGEWNPVPTGTIQYEICPELDEGLDSIYAMDVASLAAARRIGIRRRAGLKDERYELMQAILATFTNNTMDRQPERLLPVRQTTVDPYGGGAI
jgi:hypothetical protein